MFGQTCNHIMPTTMKKLQVTLIILFMTFCPVSLAALPTGFTVASTTDRLSVSWTTPGVGDVPSNFTVVIAVNHTYSVTCTEDNSPCKVTSDLSPGTRYHITVTDDSSTYKDTYYTVPLATTPVLGGTKLDDTTTQLHVSWTVTEGNPDTDLTYMVQLDSETPVSATSPETFTNLSPGTQYTVKLWSVAGQGTTGASGASYTSSITGYTAPMAPASANLYHGSSPTNRLLVSWTAAPSNGPDVTYKAQLRNDTSGSEDNITEITSLSNTTQEFIRDLTSGQLYTVYVWAVVDNLWSATVHHSLYTVPKPPTAIALESTTSPTTSLVATWTEPGDNAGTVKYRVRLAQVTVSRQTTVSEADATDSGAHTFSGLTPGAGYKVYVWAEAGNPSSNGQKSSVADSGPTAVYTKPEAPTGVTLERNLGNEQNQLKLTWTRPNNDGGVSYKVTINRVASTIDNSNEKIFSGLRSATLYTVEIWAQITDTETSDVQTVSGYTAPDMPTGISVFPIDTKRIEVKWTPLKGLVYDVTVMKEGMSNSQKTSCKSVSHSSCVIDVHAQYSSAELPGQKYLVTVMAKVSADEAVKSSPTNATPVNTNPEPPNRIYVDSRTTTWLVIKWNITSNTYSSNFVYSVSPSEDVVAPLAPVDQRLKLENLKPGWLYSVTINTVAGTSKSSDKTESFNTKPTQPTTPTRVTTTTTTELTVSWTMPANSGNFDKFNVSIPSKDSIETDKDILTATFSGLTAGTSYSVTVVSVVGNNDIQSDPSTAALLYTKPNQPKAVTVDEQTLNSIRISWTAPQGGVARYMTILNSASATGNGLNTMKYFPGLTAGTRYNISVYSLAADDTASEYVTKTYHTVPNPPVNLKEDTSVLNTTMIGVTWSAPSAGSHDGFYISIDGPGHHINKNLSSGDISATFGSLLAGAVYAVKLQSQLEGLFSSEVSQNVTTKPKPPRSLSIKHKYTESITFQWEKPDQTSSVDRYSYKVVRKDSSDTKEGQTSDLEMTVSGLTPGATYSVSVLAMRNDAMSSYTVLSEITLVPDEPSNLRENTGNKATTSIEVQWNDPASGVFISFYLEWFKDGRKVGDASPSSNSHTLSGLEPGQGYMVTVYAVSNGVKSGGLSGTFYTSLDAAKPGFVSKSTRSLTISWGDPAGTSVSHYIVYTTPKGGPKGTQERVEKSSSKTYRHEFTGLVPGQTYNSTVVVNTTGAQAKSANRVDTMYPLSVLTFAAQTSVTKSVDLTWTVSSNSKQDGFQITYGADGSKDIMAVNNQTIYVDTVTGLLPGVTYNFSIKAYSTYRTNNKVYSQTAIDDRETTRPLPVTGLTATRAANSLTSIKLSWKPGQDSMQESYVITYAGDFVDKSNVSLTAIKSTLMITNLFPGERYTFTVKAKRSDKLSDSRESQVAVFPLAPPTVNVFLSRGNETKFIPIMWTYDPSASYNTKWEVAYTSDDNTEYPAGTKSNNVDSDRQIIVSNLTPGQSYTIKVYGLTVGDVKSKTPRTLSVIAKPELGSAQLTEKSTTTSSLTVSYTEPGGAGVFDRYVFNLNPGSIKIEKAKDDQAREVKFINLIPGTVYSVDMKVLSGNEISVPLIKHILINPTAPTVDCGNIGQNSFNIRIIAPSNGLVDKYIIVCTECEVNIEKDQNADGNETVYSFTGLSPFTEYSYEVNSVRSTTDAKLEKFSTVVSGICKTNNGPAGQVESFITKDVKPYELTLEWGDPSADNGIIHGYTIEYSATKANKVPISLETILIEDFTTRSTSVTDLKAGFKYIFSIFARNGLDGEERNLTITPPIQPPALGPGYNVTPTVVNDNGEDIIQHNKVTLRFTNPFTDQNGEVVSYSIIVAFADHQNPELQGDIDDSWYIAHNQNPSPPYAAFYQCKKSFGQLNDCWNRELLRSSGRKRRAIFNDTVTIVIGGDMSCDSSNYQSGTFCNGPLKPQTRYSIFIRGHNEIYQFQDGQSVIIITDKKPLAIAAIIVPILVVLILAIIVAVLLVLWCRGIIFQKKETSSPDTFKPPIQKKGKISQTIKIEDFVNHYKVMSSDSNLQFAAEYESLKPVGKDQSYEISQLPCNRLKNRFVNILPYDHCRVKLLPIDDHGEGSSDYINASWMPGYNSKREFIVCQGPLPGTRDDHWRMIWEYNFRAIVMLTNCVENGREKCDHYWPLDMEPMYYGDLKVEITGQIHDVRNNPSEYTMTHMQISQGEQTRQLTHYHYLVWPDFGVPKKPESLLNFIKKVRSMMSYEGGPIVVHCSAGVGRSGTFICLDRILQTIEEHDAVDIYGIVHEMRLNRPFMVQTESQYVLIHECLKWELTENTGVKNNGFHDDDGTEHLYANVVKG